MKRERKSYIPAHRFEGSNWELVKERFVEYKEFRSARNLTTPKLNFCRLVFFNKGSGVRVVDGIDYRVKSKQIHLLFPGQVNKWKLGADVTGQQLIINQSLLETFPSTLQFVFTQYNRNPVLDVDPNTFKKSVTETLAIKKEFTSRNVSLELVNARCRLIALMITLSVQNENDETLSGDANPVCHRFHALLEKHFTTQKTVAFYAKQLNITPNYLGIVCRRNFGLSALEYIQERVLLEAKRLLHSTRKSIKEIAFELGFPSLTYFSYFFKAKTILTPVEYRRMIERS